MGNLANLDIADDDAPSEVRGIGSSLVAWWDAADEEDRAAFREWVGDGRRSATPCRVLSERLARAGTPISQQTVEYGLRLLRRHRWAT